MSKRMTVIFEDEELYTAVKMEAARKGRHAKDIVTEALRQWLEAREDEELSADLEERRTEWKGKCGRSWAVVEHDMERSVSRREAGAKGTRA